MLRQTPEFFADTMRTRLDGEFGGAYRYVESAVSAVAIRTWRRSNANLAYLKQRAADAAAGRCCAATPPCFTWEKNPLQTMRALVIDHLKTTVAAA